MFPMLPTALRAARRRMGLTQQQAAAKAGIRSATLSGWENGVTPKLPALVKLATALETTAPALLEGRA